MEKQDYLVEQTLMTGTLGEKKKDFDCLYCCDEEHESNNLGLFCHACAYHD